MRKVLREDAITLRAFVRDSGYLRRNGVTVSATVTTPDGGTQSVPFSWSADRDGEYTASVVPSGTGVHTIQASATADGETMISPAAYVRVTEPVAEYFGAERREALLEQLARETRRSHVHACPGARRGARSHLQRQRRHRDPASRFVGRTAGAPPPARSARRRMDAPATLGTGYERATTDGDDCGALFCRCSAVPQPRRPVVRRISSSSPVSAAKPASGRSGTAMAMALATAATQRFGVVAPSHLTVLEQDSTRDAPRVNGRSTKATIERGARHAGTIAYGGGSAGGGGVRTRLVTHGRYPREPAGPRHDAGRLRTRAGASHGADDRVPAHRERERGVHDRACRPAPDRRHGDEECA